MPFNANRARRIAHRQIVRLGGRRGAIIRSTVLLTDIMVVIIDQSSGDRRGQLIDPIARIALISTFKPDGSEMNEVLNKETDRIALYIPNTNNYLQETYRIVDRPTTLDPNGVIVYWECPVIL